MGRIRYTGTNTNGDTIKVKGILIDPSGASWVVIIQNTAGQTVFSAKGSDAVARHYPIDDNNQWVGANVTTATNITAIYLYTD